MFPKTKTLFLIFCIFSLSISYAFSLPKKDLLTFDFQNVNLRDVLRILAKRTNRNVILSPSVTGYVSLHLQQVSPDQAFDYLIKTHQLQIWQLQNIWYISSQEVLIKQKQEETKWRNILEDALPLVTQVWQIHYAKVEDIGRLLKEEQYALLSKRGHVYIDARTNILCIQDTQERLSSIYRIIKQLDVPVKQVLIETRLASIDSDYERELGIRYSVVNVDLSNENELKNEFLGNHGQFSIAIAKLADNSLLDVKLAALENEGHGELISSPSLFTANQQTASIESGEEIPYQEASSSGATAVVFKKAVLSLKVTPQVLPNQKILLQLQVNQDRPSSRLVLGVPTISTRQITTNVLVQNNHTVVLGGIFESNKENTEEGLPFLRKIPVIGWLFQVTHHRESKRELLVFVTPRIIE